MCGLFGYVSKDNKWDELNRWKFQMLGVANDDRGGDGCGIAFDGTVIKGAVPKKFDDFWRGDNVPHELSTSAIIGHDRKASVGAQTFENTQPICFESMNTILAHNGTIYNFKEMHASHKVKDHFDNDIVGMSDSQVMCMLIEKSGWQVLNEYEGSMAFLMMKVDEPGVIYAYHGKSKFRKTAMVDSEERPLYYASEDGDTWMCSTKSPLERIIVNRDYIHELPFNKVFRFDGDKMTEVYSVNRDKAFQYEDFTPVVSKPNSHYTKEWDQNDDAYYYNRENRKEAQQSALPFKPAKTKTIAQDKFYGTTADCIYYEQGYFKANSEKLDGLVSILPHGKIVMSSNKEAIHFYFYKGNLLKSQDAYIDLLHTITTEDYIKSFEQRKLWIIGKYFANPFVVTLDAQNGGDDILYAPKAGGNNGLCTIRFTGTICVPFTAKVLTIRDGELADTTYKTYVGLEMMKPFAIKDPDTSIKVISDIPSPDASKIYTCPFCLGYGSTISTEGVEIECEPCNGNGYLSKAEIASYVEQTNYGDEEIVNMFVTNEVEKARSVVMHAIDRSIDALDQIGYQDAIDFSDKLCDVKLNLWQK